MAKKKAREATEAGTVSIDGKPPCRPYHWRQAIHSGLRHYWAGHRFLDIFIKDGNDKSIRFRLNPDGFGWREGWDILSWVRPEPRYGLAFSDEEMIVLRARDGDAVAAALERFSQNRAVCALVVAADPGRGVRFEPSDVVTLFADGSRLSILGTKPEGLSI